MSLAYSENFLAIVSTQMENSIQILQLLFAKNDKFEEIFVENS